MLINLRNALMAGKRLPYDAEVEYLESTGTQYIDTGEYADLNTVLELLGCSTDNAAASWMFGARDSYKSNAFAIYNGSDRQYRYVVSYDSMIVASYLVSDVSSTTGDMVFMRLGQDTAIGGWTKSYTSATDFSTSSTILAFACWQNGVMYGKCRISSLKIYQNGVLTKDFIPVRRGTTGELYDRVSGTFATRHGDFNYGQDVVPVKYLESNGAQWIDTGYAFDSSTDEIELSFELLTTTPMYKWIFGAYDSKRIAIGSGDGVNRRTCGYNEATAYLSDSQYIDSAHIYRAYSGGVYLDGNKAISYASFQTTSKIALFTIPYGGDYALFCANARISAYEHSRSGTRLVKFRPVRVGSEGAMMDTLTRRIYRNAGTGAFLYGNDLKCPIPSE